jgi:hypothetical protein
VLEPRPLWRPDKATFDVRLRDGSRHQVRIEILSCSNIDLTSHEKKRVGDVAVWVLPGEVNRVVHDADGTNCVLFASDMEVGQLAQVVRDVASGLP